MATLTRVTHKDVVNADSIFTFETICCVDKVSFGIFNRDVVNLLNAVLNANIEHNWQKHKCKTFGYDRCAAGGGMFVQSCCYFATDMFGECWMIFPNGKATDYVRSEQNKRQINTIVKSKFAKLVKQFAINHQDGNGNVVECGTVYTKSDINDISNFLNGNGASTIIGTSPINNPFIEQVVDSTRQQIRQVRKHYEQLLKAKFYEEQAVGLDDTERCANYFRAVSKISKAQRTEISQIEDNMKKLLKNFNIG